MLFKSSPFGIPIEYQSHCHLPPTPAVHRESSESPLWKSSRSISGINKRLVSGSVEGRYCLGSRDSTGIPFKSWVYHWCVDMTLIWIYDSTNYLLWSDWFDSMIGLITGNSSAFTQIAKCTNSGLYFHLMGMILNAKIPYLGTLEESNLSRLLFTRGLSVEKTSNGLSEQSS